MNVIISNKNQLLLENLGIDIIKEMNGEFEVDEIIATFQNFFYQRMILDITAIKNYKDRFGDEATITIKKKGARKQVLSCQNGRPTEEVHVPLKRWELIKERFGFNNGKKVSDINPHNPRDFDRFVD